MYTLFTIGILAASAAAAHCNFLLRATAEITLARNFA
jgi:hypothetical protein